MISLFLIVPLVLLFVAFRIVTRVLGFGRRSYRRGGFGSNRGFGYGGYGRRRGFGGGGLLSILGLIALERFFSNRRP